MTEKDLGQIIPDILATATVDNKVGEPAVNVTVEQINEVNRLERKFNFEFVNMKGEKGDTPVKGVDYLTEEEKQQFTTETLNLVTTEGAKQVKAVTDKASEQISKVSSQGNDQISLVSAEGQKVIEQVKKLVGVNPAGGDAVSVGGKTRVEFEKDTQALAGKYNGNFPLTSAVKDAVYLVPTTGKFYICNESYSGKSLSEPNENFEELSVFKNREKLDNLKLKKNSVVRECIADGAINDEKIEKHSISHKSLNKDIVSLIFADGENMLNPNTMTPNARLKRDGSIETFESSSYTISDYIYVAPYDTITVDHRKSSNIVNDYLGCWYDSNKKYIRAVEHTDYSFSDTKKDIITIPSNAAYMRRNFWGGQKKVILVGSTEIFEDKNYTGIKKFTDDNFYISENKLKYDIQNKKGVYITGNGNNPGLFNIPFNVKIEKETLEINDIVRAEISVSTDDENFRGLRLGCIGIASVVSNNYKNLSVVETLKAELKITKQITGDWKINLGFEGKLGKDLELIVSDLKIFVNDSPVNIKTITPARQYGFKKYILLPFNKLDYKTRSILETVNNNSLTPHCWSNIKWKTVGDSITESNRTALKNYHKLISELTGIQVTNSGLSKRGYWGPTGSSFCDQLANTTDGEFDIITIFGSPNDREMFINNKGNLTDNMDLDIPVNDNYTYCARVNKCLRKATEFIKTKVVVIGPLPTSYDNYYGELLNKPQENIASGPSGYCMREMDEILEKLCAIWNIPYLSLFKKGILKPWVTEHNTAFFKQDGVGRPSYNPNAEPDGLHPNTAGHMMIVPVILNFLKEHIAIETQFEKTGDENFYIPE